MLKAEKIDKEGAGLEYRAPLASVPELIVCAFRGGGENIFRVNSASVDTSSTADMFTLRVHNLSGEPISVQIDGVETHSTNHIENGHDGGFTDSIDNYVGRNNKVLRWRPGFMRFWGDGGGELWFRFGSQHGNAILEITVTG